MNIKLETLEMSFDTYRSVAGEYRKIVWVILEQEEMTIKDLAKSVGIGYLAFLCFVNGKTKSMNFANMSKLRRYLIANFVAIEEGPVKA